MSRTSPRYVASTVRIDKKPTTARCRAMHAYCYRLPNNVVALPVLCMQVQYVYTYVMDYVFYRNLTRDHNRRRIPLSAVSSSATRRPTSKTTPNWLRAEPPSPLCAFPLTRHGELDRQPADDNRSSIRTASPLTRRCRARVGRLKDSIPICARYSFPVWIRRSPDSTPSFRPPLSAITCNVAR